MHVHAHIHIYKTHQKLERKPIYIHTAQKASWERGFNPIYTLLFDLYHQLPAKLLSRVVPLMSEPGSIFAGFQWMGPTPARFQEAFRAISTNLPNCQ